MQLQSIFTILSIIALTPVTLSAPIEDRAIAAIADGHLVGTKTLRTIPAEPTYQVEAIGRAIAAIAEEPSTKLVGAIDGEPTLHIEAIGRAIATADKPPENIHKGDLKIRQTAVIGAGAGGGGDLGQGVSGPVVTTPVDSTPARPISSEVVHQPEVRQAVSWWIWW
ncbi:uncharacterized protein L201_004125 [Kwoniella dendrophila CBS 6074]|uniref:Uncharacterized protein n=1 Tax=Kwoniella dendrophila CBS 6074 TaxID=1295534 RepID=A0AAX4JV42_9TREE